MKVKIFEHGWFPEELETPINEFLATLPAGAVKYIDTAMAATRIEETDQNETSYMITVWYED